MQTSNVMTSSPAKLLIDEQGNKIIDPNGMGLLRLSMMVITASICGGIFSLAGDLAAGGANTGAVLISWGICFVGVLSLAMCFFGLSRARPDLTGGIYAYAAAGFGDFVGFISAYGYWISGCLSNVSFALLLFSALGYFFKPFEGGNNLLSCIFASAYLWFLVWLEAIGVKEAAKLNVFVTIAKIIPLGLFIVSILLLGKFNPSIFMTNFTGEPGGPGFFEQVVSTMVALVWVFTGIEASVVISGRARLAKDVGRSTIIGFVSIFVLYMLISVLSMGVVPREQMAQLATPSMAGVLEAAIGPIGAALVNLGVVLSLLGAMLGYVIINAETPYEAAKMGTFPKIFAQSNEAGSPIVTLIVSSAITQLFLILAVFATTTYQFMYNCAVCTILVPYVASVLYFAKIAWQNKFMGVDGAGNINKARFFGSLGVAYTIFLVWSCGLTGIMITTILFTPGIALYAWGEVTQGKKILPTMVDKVIAAIIVITMAVSIYLIAMGTISVL